MNSLIQGPESPKYIHVAGTAAKHHLQNRYVYLDGLRLGVGGLCVADDRYHCNSLRVICNSPTLSMCGLVLGEGTEGPG